MLHKVDRSYQLFYRHSALSKFVPLHYEYFPFNLNSGRKALKKARIHILPVVSQILRLSKPFISCYFVMSSEGLWACCLLLIGYKDGSLLRENLNFLMVNARGYFGLGDLLHLVSISNELYNSGLLASTYLKIIGLKVHYSIGREFFQTTSQTPKLYSCKQKP